MDTCIFCKIVKGLLPSTKIYDNDHVLAFLDIAPVNIGHALIIPKKHFKNIYETPDEILVEMIKAAKLISKVVKTELRADGINVTMNNDPAAGQVVFHSHIHIIPRLEEDGFGIWQGRRPYNDGEKEQIARKIISSMK